ncbi:peptide ABC transporter ATP-binding protein [Devosia sp. Root685]|uniref:ABC transporter ATP-binding protein n=1 Tax=Devosia sp. Root685 TaxID=1736587 RepID=UPI0006FBF13E|nr:oligopeptide/dipeptide ABC transporter ATP-binding protein [Devosia sp. Root685]KRB01133.1 peptide ABC transporter ATP-binding protein [Devosia sp. Root685]
MTTQSTSEAILEFQGLAKSFVTPIGVIGHIANLFGARVKKTEIKAVAGVDLQVRRGEVVGIVGESGCGKSTVARMLAGIASLSAGEISYQGVRVPDMTREQRRAFDLGVQMIFQDPFASLNPRMRVVDIIGEPAVVHGIVKSSEKRDYVTGLMEKVGLSGAYADRYPHQFSGGQRQRIGIARALAVKPSVLICDEAVAALDVSIQAQVLNLFMDLREEFDLTYLFISHNLGVVEHISDRVVIMYLGKAVEVASTEDLFDNPNHPYTRLLLEQLPLLEARERDYQPIVGELPSPLKPPSGCPFHPRCPHVMDRCKSHMPQLLPVGPGRVSACHLNTPA